MFEGRRALLGDDLIRSYFVAQAQRPSALSDVDLAALTPYHRALLVNDGAVTRLLETAVLEPLKVDVLEPAHSGSRRRTDLVAGSPGGRSVYLAPQNRDSRSPVRPRLCVRRNPCSSHPACQAISSASSRTTRRVSERASIRCASRLDGSCSGLAMQPHPTGPRPPLRHCRCAPGPTESSSAAVQQS
jgi:hypothetical protein